MNQGIELALRWSRSSFYAALTYCHTEKDYYSAQRFVPGDMFVEKSHPTDYGNHRSQIHHGASDRTARDGNDSEVPHICHAICERAHTDDAEEGGRSYSAAAASIEDEKR